MVEKLSERVRVLGLEHADKAELEGEFVYVAEDKRMLPSLATDVSRCLRLLMDCEAPRYSPRSTTVSISTAEQWEKELMQDPKVCGFHSWANFLGGNTNVTCGRIVSLYPP